jgi:hypothetical protein
MKMRDFGLSLFIEIIALDVRYPRKLTVLNFEFDNPYYGLITERGSRQILLDSWSSSR